MTARLAPGDDEASLPQPPVALAEDGAGLWFSVVREFDLGPDELAKLAAACQLWDGIAVLDAWFEAHGWLIPGRYRDMWVPHPHVDLELRWRREWRQLIDSLRLPDAADPDVELPDGVTSISDRPKRGRLPEAHDGQA